MKQVCVTIVVYDWWKTARNILKRPSFSFLFLLPFSGLVICGQMFPVIWSPRTYGEVKSDSLTLNSWFTFDFHVWHFPLVEGHFMSVFNIYLWCEGNIRCPLKSKTCFTQISPYILCNTHRVLFAVDQVLPGQIISGSCFKRHSTPALALMFSRYYFTLKSTLALCAALTNS